MLGSDYPYDMGMLDCVGHVRGLSISDADKAAILHGTAQKLLRGSAQMNAQRARRWFPPRPCAA